MRKKTRFAITLVLAVVGVLILPPGAEAVGELTFAGCIDDNDSGLDDCAQSIDGLDDVRDVALSADGTSVYAVSQFDNAIVTFNRSSTGGLTPVGCIDDNDSPSDLCAQSVNGLDQPFAVAVSPDGSSVYVVSVGDSAVVRFNRSPTGALTPAGCVDDNDDGTDVCAQSVNGLEAATDVVVSPDGKSVYVVGQLDDALVRFNRSPTGALTPAGCVDDNDSGDDVCAQSVNALFHARSVAISPEGTSVYVVSADDNAIVRFIRSSTGALTSGGCIDDNDNGIDACAQSVNGLGNPFGVTVSTDGRSVYVASFFDDAIVQFGRSSNGALSPEGCIDDNDDGSDICARSVNGLDGARSVSVSSDGTSVYVASFVDDALVHFTRTGPGRRGTTFGLRLSGCIDDNDSGPDSCAQSVDGLDGANSVIADGVSVYAAGQLDDALVIFERQT